MTGVQTCALPICFPVTIEVIGSRHERAEIGDDGQIIEGETVDATPSEPETGSGTETPGPSSDS